MESPCLLEKDIWKAPEESFWSFSASGLAKAARRYSPVGMRMGLGESVQKADWSLPQIVSGGQDPLFHCQEMQALQELILKIVLFF